MLSIIVITQREKNFKNHVVKEVTRLEAQAALRRDRLFYPAV